MIVKYGGRPFRRIETEETPEDIEELIDEEGVTVEADDQDVRLRGSAPRRVIEKLEELDE